MEQPKISVIVPVYKVELYLRECVDSIIGQTYRNLEIVLIDDGSPDNCGAICDEYAEQDNRVRVIHQSNCGLSAARNIGLETATGDYIGFVDSDDWVEPELFQLLAEEIDASGVDIAICGRIEEYPDKRILRACPRPSVMQREEALKALLENNVIQNFVWDKLYRRELFDELRFPEGKSYEDMAIMHKLFLRSQKVACITETLYHYRQRGDSIVGDVSLKNRLCHYEAAIKRYEELREDWPQFSGLMEAQCVASAVGIWSSYYANQREERKKAAGQLRVIAEFACEHTNKNVRYTGLGMAGRIVVRLIPYDSYWAFGLAYLVGKAYQHKHGKML